MACIISAPQGQRLDVLKPSDTLLIPDELRRIDRWVSDTRDRRACYFTELQVARSDQHRSAFEFTTWLLKIGQRVFTVTWSDKRGYTFYHFG